MQTLLNRALNFSMLPLKIDITQLLVDLTILPGLPYDKNIGMGEKKMKNLLGQYLNHINVTCLRTTQPQKD